MYKDKEAIKIKSRHSSAVHFIQGLLLLVIVVGVFARYWQNQITATDLTNRSIAIGYSKANAITFHTFTYTLAGGSSLGSIKFEYCSNSPLFDIACVSPTGIDVNGAVLESQTGEVDFAIDSAASNNSTIVLARSSSILSVAGQSSYRFNNVVNPGIPNQSYYVRISMYNSLDATGPITDKGSVVFALVEDLSVNAYVPPTLTFCVGQTISNNCSSATGFDLNMGTLSDSGVATQTTQIAGATNSPTGYTVYVLGFTLTAGTNVIPPIASAASSVIGTSQFGLNARANTNPNIGQNPSPGGTLSPTVGYNTPNIFKYSNGDAIAESATSTDFNTLTISYVANTSTDQPAGVYTTTLTYVATSTF